MFQCVKCGLEFGEQLPDYCPVCHTICYICPWCGRVTDASLPQCAMLDCGRAIKYLRMTPDLRDVMLLGWGEVIQLGHVEVTIQRALYASRGVTVYRGKVSHTTGGRRSEPGRGETVVVREVMGECSARVQAIISKLLAFRHPNIVRTYVGAADEDRCCYRLLQSWVGERTLASAYLLEEGGQPPDNSHLAAIALSLAKAVEYLHSRGIIHCDITPFNVLLADDGTPVLSDFGIATLADDPGPPRGYTPAYAPIEMYPPGDVPPDIPGRGWAVGPHTDRYMLGATLYAVACGRDGRSLHPVTRTPVLVPPVERVRYDLGLGGSPQAPLAAVKRDIDFELASWIESLLSIEPETRLKSDAEMVKRITSLSRRVGKRRFALMPRLGWLRRLLKWAAAIFVLLIVIFMLRHSYTVTHSPRNLLTFAVSDAANIFGKPRAALRTLTVAPVPSAEVSCAIGRTLERMGRLDDALEAYKQGRSLDPNYAPARRATERARATLGAVSLQRGLQLYRSGEYFLADRQLSKAIHCGNCSLEGYKALAHIAERRGEMLRAARYWDMVCKMTPSSVKAHYKAALRCADGGRTEKAFYHAARARDLHLKPRPGDDVSNEDIRDLLAEVSTACMRAAEIDIASVTSVRRIHEKIVWLNRAKNLRKTAAVCAKLGRYYERLGDLSPGDRKMNYYSQAINCFEEARKLAPGSAAINADLARCREQVTGNSAEF